MTLCCVFLNNFTSLGLFDDTINNAFLLLLSKWCLLNITILFSGMKKRNTKPPSSIFQGRGFVMPKQQHQQNYFFFGVCAGFCFWIAIAVVSPWAAAFFINSSNICSSVLPIFSKRIFASSANSCCGNFCKNSA